MRVLCALVVLWSASRAEPAKKKIAYAVTVSKDGPFIDGAAVLGWSIVHAHEHSAYEPELVAIVHPGATSAPGQFAWLSSRGLRWRVVVRPVPINVSAIPNAVYRNRLPKSGCCGERELLKLWAWSLVEYHRVVHLDMDCLVLQPFDELFNRTAEVLYTEDWLMANRNTKVAPAQGGFLLLRPSASTFGALRDLAQEGDWRGGAGWGGSGIGYFFGGPTIQGIVPYFFSHLRPGSAEILERCTYNNMADNPYFKEDDECRDHTPDRKCSDCRKWPIERVKGTHFTICQKPWNCVGGSFSWKGLCAQFHQRWFDTRFDLELNLLKTVEKKTVEARTKRYGFCRSNGAPGYRPIAMRAPR